MYRRYQRAAPQPPVPPYPSHSTPQTLQQEAAFPRPHCERISLDLQRVSGMLVFSFAISYCKPMRLSIPSTLLVLLLLALQLAAPLLHAHPLASYGSKGVHLHWTENAAAEGWSLALAAPAAENTQLHQWSPDQHEVQTIGLGSAIKEDPQLLPVPAPDLFFLLIALRIVTPAPRVLAGDDAVPAGHPDPGSPPSTRAPPAALLA